MSRGIQRFKTAKERIKFYKENYTNIQIHRTTRRKMIDVLKGQESYSELIVRLIDDHIKTKKGDGEEWKD